MKNILLFLILIACQGSWSQLVPPSPPPEHEKGISADDVLRGRDLYLKMKASETWKAAQQCNFDIIEKLNFDVIPEVIINEKEWRSWVTENLKNTRFATVDEAMALRQLHLDLSMKFVGENAALFELLGKVSPEQILEITSDDY